MTYSTKSDEPTHRNLTDLRGIRFFEHLSEFEWKQIRDEHEQRIDSLLGDYLKRRSRHERNPVLDFLFEYYSFRPSVLRRWTPGIGVVLRGEDAIEFAYHEAFVASGDGIFIDPQAFPGHRLNSIRWILGLLRATASRSPRLGCYGLHEWAMVYRSNDIRHPYLPLRLSPEEIAAFVDNQKIVCSHFDAFRFFTEPARSLNHLQPERDNRMKLEQPGCVHVTMDLYKWAYKIFPWVPGELLADAFELAIQARTIDMQASPYDLRQFGLAPIKIETAEGRLEYSNEQKRLGLLAEPVRKILIEVYEKLLNYQE